MNYIIFDLEATCVQSHYSTPNQSGRMRMMPAAKVFQNEIIEIGAIKVNDEAKIVDEFSMFIKPIINPELSAFCKQFTTITQEDVDKAVGFSSVLHEFREWIGNDYILCSWGLYDKNQLKKDCELHNLETGWMDNHISLKHQHGNKVIQRKPVGMERALKQAGLKLQGTHHRGIDDARNIAQIFIRYFDVWDLP